MKKCIALVVVFVILTTMLIVFLSGCQKITEVTEVTEIMIPTTESTESVIISTTEVTEVTEVTEITEITEVTEVTEPIQEYPKSYISESGTITITKEWYKNAWCYIAHLEIVDYTKFGSSVAKDQLGSYETTSEAAERLGAIFCVNGPYMSSPYAIIRSGEVFYNASIGSDFGIYNSFTGKLEDATALGIQGKLASLAVELKEVTDVFKFYNSTLVKNGYNISNINNYTRAQRTFIATNGEPGDIYIVVAEGRGMDGESSGLTKYECAQLILDLGCTYGVMLDGGGSSTMYFNGEVLNSAKDNERAVIDFVYFLE